MFKQTLVLVLTFAFTLFIQLAMGRPGYGGPGAYVPQSGYQGGFPGPGGFQSQGFNQWSGGAQSGFVGGPGGFPGSSGFVGGSGYGRK